ncbi:hypothetical protein CSHISOI_10596 [Colletotrichum shisoi]|uniref:Uncharacterized protein n=1 Tax=Colletotrichum shisoi TaxID=2078593 RepID=A0A5Q4BD57_9PEZI|nr:hypothetical protein CSHISOI_10596 [Colletotrichum shisoi]
MAASWPLVCGPVHPLLVIWIVSDLAKWVVVSLHPITPRWARLVSYKIGTASLGGRPQLRVAAASVPWHGVAPITGLLIPAPSAFP